MPDTTTVTIRVSTKELTEQIATDYEDSILDFERDMGVDGSTTDTFNGCQQVTSLVAQEVNYTNWESLQGYLQGNGVEFDKFYDAGSEYAEGVTLFRKDPTGFITENDMPISMYDQLVLLEKFLGEKDNLRQMLKTMLAYMKRHKKCSLKLIEDRTAYSGTN